MSTDPDPALDLLEARLARLERALGRWRRAAAGALTLGLALVLSGQGGAPVTLTAERFVLRDDAGRERAVLSCDDGTVALALRDEQGHDRVGVSLDRGGTAGFTLLGPEGGARAGLVLTSDGTPCMGLHDAAGRSVMAIGVNDQGVPFMGLNDARGVTRGAWAVGADGKAQVVFFDEQGRVRKRVAED